MGSKFLKHKHPLRTETNTIMADLFPLKVYPFILISENYCISSAMRQCFSFQNNPKNLHPAYMTDLDFLDCLGRIKPVL